jgi:hypothetical protein
VHSVEESAKEHIKICGIYKGEWRKLQVYDLHNLNPSSTAEIGGINSKYEGNKNTCRKKSL